jgi:hypothetical protein
MSFRLALPMPLTRVYFWLGMFRGSTFVYYADPISMVVRSLIVPALLLSMIMG